MRILVIIGLFVLAYLLGSIPFGLIIVRLKNGKDIRHVESGRTGGTNAMRAAGIWAGIGTGALDVLKGASSVWLAKAIFPLASNPMNGWIQALVPLAAILGHNYSLFLISRDEQGRLRWRGGAGGAPCVGGSFALWPVSIFIIVPIGALVFYGIGFASVTTISLGLSSLLIFIVCAITRISPWSYAVYGVLALFFLMWSLRPNIKRLVNGTERAVGLRARRKENELSDQSAI
jgi:acyl phosphate:glycerol-3-phosphate acyltransferase